MSKGISIAVIVRPCNRGRGSSLAMVLLLAVGFISQVRADTLLAEPDAMPGFQGTTNYTTFGQVGTNPYAEELNANIEYAVFAPNNSPADLSAFGAPASNYLYAFQVFNIGYDPPPAIIPPPISLPVDITSVDFNKYIVPGDITDAGQLEPAGSSSAVPYYDYGLTPTTIDGISVKYYFETTEIGVGQESEILLFSSPDAPVMTPSYIEGGGSSQNGELPSPTSSGTSGLSISMGAPTPLPSPLLAGAVLMLTIPLSRLAKRIFPVRR